MNFVLVLIILKILPPLYSIVTSSSLYCQSEQRAKTNIPGTFCGFLGISKNILVKNYSHSGPKIVRVIELFLTDS